jgi:hypothetical protein
MDGLSLTLEMLVYWKVLDFIKWRYRVRILPCARIIRMVLLFGRGVPCTLRHRVKKLVLVSIYACVNVPLDDH